MTMKATATIMVVAVAMMVIFMTTASANEGRSVRRRRSSVTQCTGGRKVPFKICVQTADGNWVTTRGTDSDVTVRLYGANCHSRYHNLDSHADDFEAGDYDCYDISTYDVGTPVTSIEVALRRHRDNWKMDSMVLRYNNAPTCQRFYLPWWFTNMRPKKISSPQSVVCTDYSL